MAAGALAFMCRHEPRQDLLDVIIVWALAGGVCEMAASVRLREHIRGEWLLGLCGTMSVLLGLFLLISSPAGLLASSWWIAGYALIFGTLLVLLGFRLQGRIP